MDPTQTDKRKSSTGIAAALFSAVLGAGAIGSVSGCGGPEAPKPALSATTTPDRTVDSMAAALLSAGWNVRDCKYVGPKTVIVISDSHPVDLTDQLMSKIEFARKRFGLDVVGLEGWINAPDSEADRCVRERFTAVLGGASVEDYESTKGLARLFDEGHLVVQGIEGNADLLSQSALYAALDSNLGGFLDRSRDHARIRVQIGERRDESFQIIERVEAALAAEVPSLPRLPKELIFPEESERNTTVRAFTQAQVAPLERYLRTLRNWYCEQLFFERNLRSAGRMSELMNRSGAQVGLVVYGFAHTIPQRDWGGQGGPSLQERLAEQGLSYIVVDLFPKTELAGRKKRFLGTVLLESPQAR